jgi:HKD family nuclease
LISIAHQLTQDTSFGFLDSKVNADQVFHPLLVSNSNGNTMLRAIRDEIKRSSHFVFSVAFITPSAIAMLKQAILDYQGSGKIITSTYLGFNSPAAFRELLNLDGISVYVHPDSVTGFHAKGYIFEQNLSTTAIVGSSNLTERALLMNHEWNLRFSALPTGDIVQQLNRAVKAHIEASVLLTKEWIDEYELTWLGRFPKKSTTFVSSGDSVELSSKEVILPNSMQTEALTEIAALRESGKKRGIVISATGTGKTIISAFDFSRYYKKNPQAKFLFVAHRQEILIQALNAYRGILRNNQFGELWVGSFHPDRFNHLFASIQTLNNQLDSLLLAEDYYDYIVIDEVHHIAAQSYRGILQHFKPKILLGLTATPEDDLLIGFRSPLKPLTLPQPEQPLKPIVNPFVRA